MTFLTRRFVLPLMYLLLTFLFPIVLAQNSYETATVVSVRQIKRMSGLSPSRYSGPVYFTVDFALRVSAESYCVGYETPVLDEVQDLMASNGKDITVQMRGKKLVVVLPTGRRIKAELVKQAQC